MSTLTMPLFPLAAPALFPHCVAPLHVFEPRYRALTADVLAGERRIGMATVRPEALAAMAGDPPLFAIGCAGFVAQHQRLADGRYLLLLQATGRFRILDEPPRPPDRLYRVASVERLDEPAGDGTRAAQQRAAVMRELRAVLEAQGAAGEPLDLARIETLDDVRFACDVAHALRLPGPEKQALLEAADAAERLERIAQTLAFYRAAGAGPGDETVH